MTTNTAVPAATPEPLTFAEALGLSPEKMRDLLAKQRRREQRRRRKVALPPPRLERPEHPLSVIGSDGRLCVSIRLTGKHGSGKRMVLDAVDWERVRRSHGDRWAIRETKPGYSYVVGTGKADGTYLARVGAKAPEGTVVGFRNGDTLDLARGNLMVQTAAEARQRAFTRTGAGRALLAT